MLSNVVVPVMTENIGLEVSVITDSVRSLTNLVTWVSSCE